ncbi:MAG TPA: DivIVA domain-containing protein [Acidimicrobiales bacterium]|nr:DivIVA domain-containing protein [Acidimicrobiales bacterium]
MSPEPPLDATGIARRHFSTARKGYDADEVRAFLHELSDLVGRLQRAEAHERERAERAENRAELAEKLDQHRLVELLGEETARVLDAAREAGADIRTRAEEKAARLVRDAQVEARAIAEQAEEEATTRRREILAEADDLRREAEAEVERRRGEGQVVVEAMRQEAEQECERMVAEGDQVRREAEAAAEQIRASAREEGRRLVGEAQTVRERILSDLARRRRVAREQLERLNGARERLLAAYEVVRRTVDEATAELTVALPEAKLASEMAMRRVNHEPEETVEVLEAELSVARMAGLVDDLAGHAVSDEELDEMLRDLVEAEPGDEPSAVPGGPGDTGESAGDGADRSADDDMAGVGDEPGGAGQPVGDEPGGPGHPVAAEVDVAGGPSVVDDGPVGGSPAPDAVTAAAGHDQGGPTADVVDLAGGGEDTRGAVVDHVRAGDPELVDLSTGTAGDRAPAAAAVATEVAPAPPPEGEGDTGPYVDELFARIRAQRTVGEAGGDQPEGDGTVAVAVAPLPARTAAEVAAAEPVVAERAVEQATADEVGTGTGTAADEAAGETDEADGTLEADRTLDDDPATVALRQRDALLAAVERDLGRRLKRVLADEQNEVLDLLRRGKSVAFADVVPAADEHADRYAIAATPELDIAAEHGAVSVGGLLVESADDLAGELGRVLVEPLRARIARSFDDCDGDLEEVTERLRALYREWKGQHIGAAVRHFTAAAYAWGAYRAAPEGTVLRWLVDRTGEACPDADDNALAGAVTKGRPFPTGDRHAPAHPGCRCLVVPAHQVGGG